MSASRPYIALGLTQQGRMTPTALLQHEDATGLCNTCPAELDSAESCYLRDPVRTPPAVPWRVLGAGCVVLICVPLVLHLVLVLMPAALQVAAR